MPSPRVAFISDLHANLVALDAVLAELDELGVDEIICLGDIVDLGPQPQAVVDRLHARGIRCVRGNHDPLDEHPAHPVLAEVEAWTRAKLDPATLAELCTLPDQLVLELAGARILCVHGSPSSFNDQVLASTPSDTLLAWTGEQAFDLMVCGHTHVQLLRRVDAQVFVNVGSLGMPFARPFCGATPQVLPWAEYAIISATGQGISATGQGISATGQGISATGQGISATGQGISVDLRRTPYDLDRFAASLHAAGFPGADRWLDNWRINPRP